jgi:hypothetical protein
MAVEATVSVAAGIIYGSLIVLAFGLDSVIELVSAGVLMWRLSVELRRGQTFSERSEHIARGPILTFASLCGTIVCEC